MSNTTGTITGDLEKYGMNAKTNDRIFLNKIKAVYMLVFAGVFLGIKLLIPEGVTQGLAGLVALMFFFLGCSYF